MAKRMLFWLADSPEGHPSHSMNSLNFTIDSLNHLGQLDKEFNEELISHANSQVKKYTMNGYCKYWGDFRQGLNG